MLLRGWLCGDDAQSISLNTIRMPLSMSPTIMASHRDPHTQVAVADRSGTSWLPRPPLRRLPWT